MVDYDPNFDPEERGHEAVARGGECHAVTTVYPEGPEYEVDETRCGISLRDADLFEEYGPRKDFIGEFPMCEDCWPDAVFPGDADAE